MIPDPATAAAAMQRGEADWWERPFNDLLPLLLKDPGIASMIADPSGRMSVLRFNCLHPPFDNVKVRQAVRLAVNQEDTCAPRSVTIRSCGAFAGRYSPAARLMARTIRA